MGSQRLSFIQMEYSTGLYYGSWNSAMAGGVLEASSVSDSIMLGLETATSKSDDATPRPLIPPWKPGDLRNAGLQPDREFGSLSGTIVVVRNSNPLRKKNSELNRHATALHYPT